VLFDAHELEVADNLEQTTAVVAEAHGHGAHVEGEIEGIEGVEDDIGSDDASTLQSLEVAVDFITKTGVDVFAPAIGNAHGQYKSTPKLNHQRVTDLVEATNIPMALHGGTGLSPDQFRDLISRGCAKVNISTAIKESYMRSALEHLRTAEEKNKWDPPTLFAHQRDAVLATAREHIALFGGSGRAW
jgi:fructose-bisphosphate aldolase class II